MAKVKVSPTEVQEFLAGLEYPAMKDEIIDFARDQGARDEVVDTLERLPDQEYDNPTALSEEIGGME